MDLNVYISKLITNLERFEEIKTDDKNDTYFLLAAEEKAIDYSRI